MSIEVPAGYLGAEARITSGPAPELIASGYTLETADAPLLHEGLGLADLAHVLALVEAGVVPASAAKDLARELLQILSTPPEEFPYDPVYGDAYNSRERELESRIGDAAGWLHTGRTRREAGRIAFRIALRRKLLDLHDAVGDLALALASAARLHAETLWADTTYLQPAQPSTFGHYLGAFAEETTRHFDRIQAAHRWANRSPAGSGGVGGSPVLVNRKRDAATLGFDEPGWHTRDIMWSVDGLVDAVVSATQTAATVDRLAEDLEIFASPAFGYVRLDASLCRASVLMPQKRNPYALAVIRAGAGVLLGRTSGLMATQRTPSARTDNWLHAYGEVASSVDLATRLVRLGTAVVRSLEVDEEALARAAGAHFTGAADLAESMVLHQGLDYRSAYRVVGRAVAAAVEGERTVLDRSHLDIAAWDLFGHGLSDLPDVESITDPATIVSTRDVLGGSAPNRVREHAERIEQLAGHAQQWARDTRTAAEIAEHAVVRRAEALTLS
ncbi:MULTISPECIES: lyase family protein [unclassified Nocardioides]|uniref:lyase family protein n=1 Tax=Nocardioides sp. (strain ATCC BAA-499 / JS614) TaxID=196162 RepID=UPI000056FD47|nr:argininosuccinate lyase [Nocardioides sp. JS614]